MSRLLALVALCLTTAFIYAAEPEKIVFLHGKRSHKSGEHEFRAGCMLLADHLNRQDAVPVETLVILGWPEDETVLEDAAAIVIFSDATRVVQDGWETMDRLCKQGTGLMLIHYAVHPKPDQGEQYFMPWIGGYFKNGQSVNPFWAPEITPLAGHEVANGIKSFRALDEFYFNLKHSPAALPFGVATPGENNLLRVNNVWNAAGHGQKDQQQILLWGYERETGGRGAGFTGGHYHRNWAIDDYRRLVLNTIVWIAGREVPADGIPSPAVTKEELNANLDQYGAKTAVLELPSPEDFEFTNGQWLTPAEHAAKRKKLRQKK